MTFNMKYNINKDYIAKGTMKRPGNGIKVQFIVAHDTGNPGSTAQNNVDYYKRVANESYASAHIFVDDKQILECIPALTGPTERAYHVIYDVTKDNELFGVDANDGAIGVEFCYGNGINFTEAYKKYVWVIAYICFKFNIDPRKKITGHFILDPARKTDPVGGLKFGGKTFPQFLADVVTEYNNCIIPDQQVKPIPQPTGVTYKIQKDDTFWGIATRLHMNVNDLMKLNPGVDPKKLSEGMEIIIGKK